MVIMTVNRRDEALTKLADAIRAVVVPNAPTIRKASVEPFVDADGEAALKAVIVLDAPEEDGWSAEFTHALRRQVNRLAAEQHLDEHVYVALFTQDEFEAREDESLDDSGTHDIDVALNRDQQDGL
jgi:hypothetical protein